MDIFLAFLLSVAIILSVVAVCFLCHYVFVVLEVDTIWLPLLGGFMVIWILSYYIIMEIK